MDYRITHRTTFSYAHPVATSYQLLHLTPRSFTIVSARPCRKSTRGRSEPQAQRSRESTRVVSLVS